MKKYLWCFGVVVLLSVVVTRQHENYAQNSIDKGTSPDKPIIFLETSPEAQPDREESHKNSPCWDIAYLLLGWPNGITVWALFLTMIVIAEQTMETRKAAGAAQKTMLLQFRPRIVLRTREVSASPTAPVGTVAAGHLIYRIHNVGDGYARILSGHISFKIISDDIPIYVSPPESVGSFELPPGSFKELTATLDGMINDTIKKELQRFFRSHPWKEQRVFLSGEVTFRDEGDVDRTSEFYRMYISRLHWFKRVKNSEREFEA